MDFLRLKQKMVASDHNAVFADGTRRLVYIYHKLPGDPPKHCVEIETGIGPQFFDIKVLSNFVRLELTPEGRAVREEEQAEKLAAEAAASKPTNFAELKAEAERQARQAANERYQQHRAQSGIAADPRLANANREFAQLVAQRKGQSR